MLLLYFLMYMINITTTYFVELADFLKRPEIGSSTLKEPPDFPLNAPLQCTCQSVLPRSHPGSKQIWALV
jgi:hypothetical protein